jgi:phosphatidylserine/phosphatidylglycerophosphate/cardiolipin synthase-like enzyme
VGGHGGRTVTVDGVRVTPWFSPTDGVMERLADASEAVLARRLETPTWLRAPLTIRICGFTMFYAGTERFIESLGKLRAAGADVRVIMDGSTSWPTGSSRHRLQALGIPVGIADYGVLMHHKFVSVEEGRRGWVWTGSPNFTRPASSENDESALLIESVETAAAYRRLYETLLDNLFLKEGANP